MIKGVILDVDGIIVGEKVGYNSPYPHPEVMARLKAIEESGVFVSLCSAKPHHSLKEIIDGANLRNLHITDGGGVVIDPIDDVVLKSHVIDKQEAKSVVEIYLKQGVYTEVYTLEGYYIQSDQRDALTETHTHILQTAPKTVVSLLNELDGLDIVKIMPVAKDESDKDRLTELFTRFKDNLTLSWGVHPIANPHKFGIITAKGISKKQAALEIMEHTGTSSDNFLGIGDSTSDWQFIEQCGYAGTLSNGTKDLKDLVNSKGGQGFVSDKSVDENGVLEIFNYFNL